MAKPPHVDGYVDARPIRDGLRMTVWTLRGYRHGATKRNAPMGDRIRSGVLLIGSIVFFPILAVAMPILIGARPHTRFYMNADRDAAIAISAGRKVWRVADHSAAHPGTKKGQALRRGLVPGLLERLDDADAELQADAVNKEIATRYEQDVPGLQRTGKNAWPRGLKMRRRRRSETE